MRRTLVSLILLCTVASTGVEAQNGLVVLDNVSYQYTPTQLRAGSSHQIEIRYDLTGLSSTSYWFGSNGFEVYSPDGADWGYLQGTTGPLVATAADRGTLTVFQKHHYFDGSSWSQTGNGGLDPAPGSAGSTTRAGFTLFTMSIFGDAGYVGGLDNDIALSLEFESVLADANLNLCLDTCNQIVAWEWTAGSSPEFPQWNSGLGVSGPRCWEIFQLPCGCCGGRVGDVNGSGEGEPTIADVSVMIDAKFLTGSCDGIIQCLEEADINQSGGPWPTCDDVTISDISYLIDYLFITGPVLDLPSCMLGYIDCK